MNNGNKDLENTIKCTLEIVLPDYYSYYSILPLNEYLQVGKMYKKLL